MKNFLKIFLLIILISNTIPAQSIKRIDGSSISTAELEKNINRLMKEAKVTGLNIAVFNDSKISYLKSFGFRDKEKGLPMDETTSIYGASLTKALFAYFVMDLVEKGLIDLDKPVYQYLEKPLPEYKAYADLASDDRYKLITMRMLLGHTSGFPNWRWLKQDGTLDENGKLSIYFAPGSRYAYSGEGIMLAQFVVEAITKKPLKEMIRERIFDRFGMTGSSMIWDTKFDNKCASGYDEKENALGCRRKKSVQAAGSLSTTLTDFAKFIEVVMQGRDLKTKTLKEMFKPQIEIYSKSQFPTLSTETTDENRKIGLSYGLGWGLMKTPHGKAFFKEGHDDGWQNYAVCFPDKKIGVLIMTNSSNGESIFKELLETAIKDTYTPWKWENYIPYNQAK